MAGFENDVLLCSNVNFNPALPKPHTGLITTNGQLIIGSTALNAGGTHLNIGVLTSPSGTITIGYSSPNITLDSAVGTNSWVNSAGGALVNHTGYFATAAAVYTLPAGVANGDKVEIVDFIGGGVVVTAQGGNKIRLSNTTSAANGTATSTQVGDALRLVFSLTYGIWVCVPSAAGLWNVV